MSFKPQPAVKFGPAHFPVGTVFTVDPELPIAEPDNLTYEVKQVIRNGPRSYILETTRISKAEVGGQRNVTLNIGWVSGILSRGSGPLLINPSYHGVNKSKAWADKTLEELDRMELRRFRTDLFQPRRKFYSTGSLATVLMYEASKVYNSNESWSMRDMITALQNQSWTQACKLEFFQFRKLNKKRLRKWLRQNRNRFLVDLSELEHRQREEEERWMHEDLEREYKARSEKETVTEGAQGDTEVRTENRIYGFSAQS